MLNQHLFPELRGHNLKELRQVCLLSGWVFMASTPHVTVKCYYEAEIAIYQNVHTIFSKLKQVFLGPNLTKNFSSPSVMEHFTRFLLEITFILYLIYNKVSCLPTALQIEKGR